MASLRQFHGALLILTCASAYAVDPGSVSIQDIRPECRERHAAVAPEHCMIEDRLSRNDYLRRFGSGTVVVVEPPALPPAVPEPPVAPRESVNRPTL